MIFNQFALASLCYCSPLGVDGVAASGGGGGTTNVDVVANTIGLATEATLGNVATESSLLLVASESTLSSLNGKVTAVDTGNVTISSSALPTGASTEATLSSLNGKVTAVDTGAVVVSSSALPSGASTSALQTAGNASLTTLEGTAYAEGDTIGGTDKGVLIMGRNGTNSAKPIHITSNGDVEVEIADFVKGQAVSASSFPVVIASDQSQLSVEAVSQNPNASVTTDSLAPTAGSTAVTTGVDLDGTNGNVSFFGTSSNTTDAINVQFSDDNVTYYTSQDYFVTQDFTSGAYAFNIADLGVRYVRLQQIDSVSTAWTWTSKASKK